MLYGPCYEEAAIVRRYGRHIGYLPLGRGGGERRLVSPLISVAELAADLAAFTILDVRYKLGGPPGRAEFAAGHVPGAVYVDLDRDLAAPAGKGGRHPLPDATAFASAMRNAGVSNAWPVVVYDDWGARAAGRAWWLLRCFRPISRSVAAAWQQGEHRRLTQEGGSSALTLGPGTVDWCTVSRVCAVDRLALVWRLTG